MKKPEETNKRKEMLDKVDKLKGAIAMESGLHQMEHKAMYDILALVKDLIEEVYEDINQL